MSNIRLNRIRNALYMLIVISGAAVGKADKPNVVMIVVDNWGWSNLSVQGSTIPTPNIDRLASEGLRLTNYNVESQCMPSRAAIHTARLPIRSGTAKNDWSANIEGLAPWEYTLAELFHDEGYKTAMFGKWHLGATEGRYPTDQGYDEWFGIVRSTNESSYAGTPGFDPENLTVFNETPAILKSRRGASPERAQDYDLKTRGEIDGMIVDHSTKYLEARGVDRKPFLLTVTFTQVHGPLVPHPDFRGKSGAGDFPDILMELDHNVGRILAALKRAGLEDSTLIALSGENSALVELGWGSNGPWRGGLGTGWEGGLRTPAMIRWPGKIAAGRVSDEIVAALDWLPTLAHIIGAQERIPGDRPIDGIDQSAFFLGQQQHSNREHILYYIGDQLFAGKWRDFKVHFITREGRISQNKYWSVPLLYNVKRDPGEYLELNSTDIIGRYIWAAAELLKVIGEKKASMEEYPNIKPGTSFEGYRQLHD